MPKQTATDRSRLDAKATARRLPDESIEDIAKWIEHKGIPDELIKMFEMHFGKGSDGPKMMRNEVKLFTTVAEMLREHVRVRKIVREAKGIADSVVLDFKCVDPFVKIRELLHKADARKGENK